MKKICRACKLEKNKEIEFNRGSADCKICVLEIRRNYRKDNPIVTKLIDSLDGEKWAYVNGYEKFYRISSFGRLTSLCKSVRGLPRDRKDEKIIKPPLNTLWGYYTYSFSDWGRGEKDKCISIHRLVAIHFIENPNNLPEVNHKDGVKTNNNVENLEWVTREENIQHGFRTGLIKTLKGENAHNCTLTNEQVLFIFNHKGSPRKLSRDLKMPYSRIASIRNGVSWNHITGAPKKYYGKEKNKPRYT